MSTRGLRNSETRRPVRVALTNQKIMSLAIRGDDVFWTCELRTSGALMRAPLTGGSSETVVPTQKWVVEVRSGGDEVLFALAGDPPDSPLTLGQVMRLGASGSQELISDGQSHPGSPMRSGSRYFWLVFTHGTGLNAGPSPLARVRWRSVTGGPVKTVDTLTDVASYVVAGDSVVAVDTLRQHLVSVPIDGGPFREIHASSCIRDPIVGPDGSVYVAEGNPPAPGEKAKLFGPARRIVRISPSGEMLELHQSAEDIWSLATDGVSLFWSSSNGVSRGAIVRMPLQGGAEEELFRDVGIGDLVVTHNAIAWVKHSRDGDAIYSPEGALRSL